MRSGVGVAGIALALLVAAAPAHAGTPGPTESLGHVGTLEYLKATFDDVVSQTGAPAECDDGDTVTGGGGTISGSGSSAALNATYPSSGGGDGWLAEGSTTSITPRKVTTYAICGAVAMGWSSGTSPVAATGDPGDVLLLSDSCVFELALGGTQGVGGDVRILSTRPSGDLVAWSSTVENFDNVSASGTEWYACTNEYDPSLRTESVKVASGEDGKATARCHSDEAVIAGGLASTAGGDPGVSSWATSTRPYDSKDRKKTPDDGWQAKVQDESQGRVKVTAYALCLPR